MRSIFALLLLVILTLPASAQTPPGWIADGKTGCRVWNGSPETGETITWTGGCQNNLAQGLGVLQWFKDGKPNGRYEGEYRAGKPNGRGVLTLAGGARYEGEFRDGKKSGQGVATSVNGSRFEGEWRDDKPNGQGTLKLSNGNTYSGTWTKGCFKQGDRVAFVIATKKECGFE